MIGIPIRHGALFVGHESVGSRRIRENVGGVQQDEICLRSIKIIPAAVFAAGNFVFPPWGKKPLDEKILTLK